MGELRTNSSRVADLLITLDRDGGVPMHRQIVTGIRDGIRRGQLPRGSHLPPSRALAADLEVSRGVVVEAYQQLTAEGYLSSKPGGYTTVSADATSAVTEGPGQSNTVAEGPGQSDIAYAKASDDEPASSAVPTISFGYGRADPAHFPRSAWLRSITRVLTQAPTERFSYPTGHGTPELRQTLADYLNRVRGTAARPHDIVICNGFAQGIALVIGVLASQGVRRLAVEDPSPVDELRPVAAAAGIELAGIPVGTHGIQADLLDAANVAGVIVTPSHQWPTGSVLGPDQRAALLRWARQRSALIIEDDYDAEYRYDRAPVGALHGLAPEHVIYAGTASKTLAPALRLGWLILPGHLVGPVAAAKIAADRGSPVIDQLAFADFLTRGEFDRHLRRMRPVYRRRRDMLLTALGRHLPELHPDGISAGFHLVAWLPPGLTEDAVVAAAAQHGVGVSGLAPYRLQPGPPALLFGYAGLGDQAIVEGVRMLARAIRSLDGS